MSDAQEYYGYKPKATTPPPAEVQEEVVEPEPDFPSVDPSESRRGNRAKRAPREPKVKPERKPAEPKEPRQKKERPVKEPRKSRAQLRKEAVQAKKDAARINRDHPDTPNQTNEFGVSGSGSSDSTASRRPYDAGSGTPGEPDEFGVVREIEYGDITTDFTTQAEVDAAEEFAGMPVDDGPRKGRGRTKKAPKKAPVKKTGNGGSSNAKKGKKDKKSKTENAIAIEAMMGPKPTAKQRKDAKKIDAVAASKSFRQLSLMMSVSRDEIGPIRRIADQYKGTPIGTVFAKISTDMADNNISFSAAFDKHGKVFPAVVVSLVSVGAKAGKESEALNKAADIIQDNAKTASQVKSALSEPAFTLALTVGFLFVVLFGIIPQFKVVFDTLGKPLPTLSQILLNASTVSGYLVGIIAVALIVWFIYWRKAGQFNVDLRVKIDTWKLNMKPKVFAELMQISQLSQLFGNVHTLREINMSERDTLINAARSASNWAIKLHLLKHVDLMDKGEARFKEFANNKKLFPVDAAYTLVVGEDAGRGTQTLGLMAETYKTESELAAAQLVVAIGPIANGAVGVVYMLVMLASYLPVFELYTSIGEVD